MTARRSGRSSRRSPGTCTCRRAVGEEDQHEQHQQHEHQHEQQHGRAPAVAEPLGHDGLDERAVALVGLHTEPEGGGAAGRGGLARDDHGGGELGDDVGGLRRPVDGV